MFPFNFFIFILFIGKLSVNGYIITNQCLPKTMRGVGVYEYLPLCNENSIVDFELSLPELRDKDVLIEVRATSVNPVDTLIRSLKSESDKTPLILSRDGAGVIVGLGPSAKLFKIGDQVFFLTEFGRNGTSAQFVATNENTVALKPKRLSFEEAASLPLTATTAYDSLYNELAISDNDKEKSLLIINSGGGVGSIASQLARNLGLKVIGTASRPETVAFSKKYGVDVVLNHREDLLPQLRDKGLCEGVDFVLVNYNPVPYWNTILAASKPGGRVCALRDAPGVNLNEAFEKNIGLTCELSSVKKSKLSTGEMLRRISSLVDEGKLRHTLSRVISPINAANLREAHQILEKQQTIGKIVLSGF